MRGPFPALATIGIPMLLVGCGFAAIGGGDPFDGPGFLLGIWHGLLAPWTLLLRLVIDIRMYAFPNAGWTYDLGFLLGVSGSLPIGWMAAVVALVVHVLG